MEDKEIENIKQQFLAIIKWCSANTGAKVVFDIEEGCPRADVNNKVIHMPTSIPLSRAESTLGTIIHESMHIKHTPKWLGYLCRDMVDHTIFNALEDARIETIACRQLKALNYFLNRTVDEVRAMVNPKKVSLGSKVLANIACSATGIIFEDNETSKAECENTKLHKSLKDIYGRIFTVSMASSFEKNVVVLYEKIDEFRKIYKLPNVDPSTLPKKEELEAVYSETFKEGIGQYGLEGTNGLSSREPGHNVDKIDLDTLNPYLVDLNQQAKDRIKETLKKTMTTIIDEGRNLNTDNLISIFTGDIDNLFIDEKSERKMRTKVYFLMDTSGSMDSTMGSESFKSIDLAEDPSAPDDVSGENRQHLAIASFKAISEVIDECRDVYGTDISYENYVFADSCAKVNQMSKDLVGGGTNLSRAMAVVFKEIHGDDPANKRILVIMTDGDVGSTKEIKDLINKEAQDIRVVFVGITDNPGCDLIKHNILHEGHSEAMIVEAMEEAL